MSYTFEYCNGNVGDKEIHETKEEAIRAAESYWSHLTPKERADHGSEHGGWCMVYEDDDESKVIWFRDPDKVMTVYFTNDEKVYRFDVPESEDVWDAIGQFDDEHGTDMWDHLDDSNVLGVNLCEYPEATPVTSWDDVEERIDEVTADMQIRYASNGLMLRITEQARMLGVGRGDVVNVTIRRK